MLCYELMEAVNGAASESTLAHYGAQANGLTVVLTEKVEQVSLSEGVDVQHYTTSHTCPTSRWNFELLQYFALYKLSA